VTEVVLYNAFNGLVIGAFYALMALGLSLILNLSGVINFAHGGFLAVGAYLAYTVMPWLGFWGALIVAPLLTAVLGLVLERLVIRRTYGRDPLYSLLLTFGLALILEDSTRSIWGPQTLPFAVPDALNTLTAREAHFGQNGRGGKYTWLHPSQRCRRNSPDCVPSQKCCVSGVGWGRARPGSGIGRFLGCAVYRG